MEVDVLVDRLPIDRHPGRGVGGERVKRRAEYKRSVYGGIADWTRAEAIGRKHRITRSCVEHRGGKIARQRAQHLGFLVPVAFRQRAGQAVVRGVRSEVRVFKTRAAPQRRNRLVATPDFGTWSG